MIWELIDTIYNIGLALTAIFISYLWLSREPEKSEKNERKKVEKSSNRKISSSDTKLNKSTSSSSSSSSSIRSNKNANYGNDRDTNVKRTVDLNRNIQFEQPKSKVYQSKTEPKKNSPENGSKELSSRTSGSVENSKPLENGLEVPKENRVPATTDLSTLEGLGMSISDSNNTDNIVSSSNADQNTNQTPGRKTSRRGNFIHKPADNVLSLKPASRSRSRSRSRIRNELANKLNSLIDDDEIESSVGPETLGTPKNAKKELISAVSTKTEETMTKDEPEIDTKFKSNKSPLSEAQNRIVLDRSTIAPFGEPLVVDLGSMWTRIGMTNEQQPKTIERTMKGRIRKTIYQNSSDQYILYGNDVSSKSGILHPIDLMANGEVNWSDVSDLIEFYSSRRYEIEIQDQPLTLSTFFHDKKLKKEAIQQLFEARHCPAVCLGNQSKFSLFGAGYTSGLVSHAGHQRIEISAFYEGIKINHATRIKKNGGRDLVDRFHQYMRDERATPMNSFSEREYLRLLIENNARFEVDNDTGALLNQSFDLPDGRTINIGDGLKLCTNEFLPSASEYKDVLSSCDTDLLSNGTISNLVLAGGVSKLPGYYEETKNRIGISGIPLKVIQRAPHGELLSWYGAAAISSMSSYMSSTITKEQYAEYGDTIISRIY